jgi:hypothetical protein
VGERHEVGEDWIELVKLRLVLSDSEVGENDSMSENSPKLGALATH